jgi:hypothetical protein
MGYFVFIFTSRLRSAAALRRMPGAAFSPDAIALLAALVGAAIAIGATLVWIFASATPALRFTEAEIHLLLPAPLPRRQLLAYALLKQQLGIGLLGAIVVAALRGPAGGGRMGGRFIGTWALFTLVDLHIKGVSLLKSRLAQLPCATSLWLRLTIGIALVAFWAAFIAAVGPTVSHLLDQGANVDVDALLGAARSLLAGPAGLLLAPFVGIARPLVGAPASAWTVLYLALLVAAHWEWVLRSRARFEDASLERAVRGGRGGRQAARGRPARRSRRGEPFALPPLGAPELAIVWKNLTQVYRRPLWQRAMFLAALPTVLLVVAVLLGAPPALISTCEGCGLGCLIIFPPICGLVLRNDLRAELQDLDRVRCWPLPATRLVAAELVAPASLAWSVLVAGYVVSLAAATARALVGTPMGGPSVPIVGVGEGSLLLVAACVALLSITLQNFAALTLPAWITSRRSRQPRSVMTGQRLLLFLAHLLGLVVALVPAALLVGAVVLVQRLLGADLRLAEAPPLAVLACLPILAAVAVLIRLAARRWERLDPSRELLGEEG